MIDEFLQSWDLFQHAYLEGWFMMVTLSVAGVVVVGRDQIFIGAALAEASTLGIALVLWLSGFATLGAWPWLDHEGTQIAFSFVFALSAALLMSMRARGIGTFESVTGWVFLVGGSVSILLVYHSPHGLEEVHRILSTSMIGATRGEVWLHGALAVAVVAAVAWLRLPLLLVTLDEEMAQARGLSIKLWSLGLSAGLAAVISPCIRAAGLPYTFGCLVLPALAARPLCRGPLSVFVVAPILGLVTSAVAFLLANHFDQPPGQVTVASLCVVAAATTVGRRVLGDRS